MYTFEKMVEEVRFLAERKPGSFVDLSAQQAGFAILVKRETRAGFDHHSYQFKLDCDGNVWAGAWDNRRQSVTTTDATVIKAYMALRRKLGVLND